MGEDFITIINIYLAPIAGMIVILVDYHGKHPTDKTQMNLFTCLICFTLAAILCDIANAAVSGLPGESHRTIQMIANTLYFLFQPISLSIIVLFFEHTLNKNSVRLKRMVITIGCIIALYAVTLVINFNMGWYFYVTQDNYYVRGKMFAVVLFVPYIIMLTSAILIIKIKQMNPMLFILVLVSVIPATLGSITDVLTLKTRLMWPSFSISILFCYLFIIRTTMRIDSLTKVYNRRACDEYLISITAKSSRHKEYAFIMVDIDRFKQINDHFGHTQGDNALRDAAGIMQLAVRRSDFVARYGGDEFIIIAATNDAKTIIENITSRINEFNMKKMRPYTLALSCGGDVYQPDDSRTPLEFLSHVDALMYAEKERRRQR